MKKIINKFFMVLVLSFPMLGSANTDLIESGIEDKNSARCVPHSNSHCHCNKPEVDPCNQLRLSHFEGNYRTYSTSIGGIAGVSPNAAPLGLSTSSVSQLSFGKTGLGTINFLSTAIYTGPVGTPLTVLSSNTGFPILALHLVITDAAHGAGIVTIENFPIPGSNLVGDFVATTKRDGDSCRVEEFIVNITGYTGPNAFSVGGASLIFVSRQ